MSTRTKVGVLAIQGDYEAHRAVFERLGVAVLLVRKPEQLDAIDAIVIPGGESSTFLNFLEEHGFLEKLRDFVRTKPAFSRPSAIAGNLINRNGLPTYSVVLVARRPSPVVAASAIGSVVRP